VVVDAQWMAVITRVSVRNRALISSDTCTCPLFSLTKKGCVAFLQAAKQWCTQTAQPNTRKRWRWCRGAPGAPGLITCSRSAQIPQPTHKTTAHRCQPHHRACFAVSDAPVEHNAVYNQNQRSFAANSPTHNGVVEWVGLSGEAQRCWDGLICL